MAKKTDILTELVAIITPLETWKEIAIKNVNWQNVSYFPSCYIAGWNTRGIITVGTDRQYPFAVTISIWKQAQSSNPLENQAASDTLEETIEDAISTTSSFHQQREVEYVDNVRTYHPQKDLIFMGQHMFYTINYRRRIAAFKRIGR